MQNLVEYLILGGLLLWSCYFVLRRFLPKTSFRWQQAIAQQLENRHLNRLSRWMTPKLPSGGCSSGCSGCTDSSNNSTACDSQTSLDEQPVSWRS